MLQNKYQCACHRRLGLEKHKYRISKDVVTVQSLKCFFVSCDLLNDAFRIAFRPSYLGAFVKFCDHTLIADMA